MRRAVGRTAALGIFPRAFDRAHGQLYLGFTGTRRDLLHRPALLVTAEEVHAAVDARGIATQRALHEADALDEVAPVDFGAQPQGGDGIGDGDLRDTLPLMLRPDRILGRHSARLEVGIQRALQQRYRTTVFARPLEELHDGREVDVRGPRHRSRSLRPVEECVGERPSLAGAQDFDGQAAQILDQRQCQHAGPRPELANCERRHSLVGVDERLEPRLVDPAVAVPHQLDRHRVDSGQADVLPRRQRRQLPVVRPGQVAADLDNLRRDQMKVVEKPLGGAGDVPARAQIRRQCPVRACQRARVVVEAREDAGRA